MRHQRLRKAARAAIEELFSDMSVSQETTIYSLESLIDDIEMKIEAIKCDMEAE